MRNPAAREQLLAALSDEDREVVAWAAYGLGDACANARADNVRALAAASVRLRAAGEGSAQAIDPIGAVVRAVGRCAADTSEAILIDWARARGPEAEHAAYALGDVATQRGHLREETLVALLDLAAGSASEKPWPTALYPLGRATHLPPSVIERAREVAIARLAEASPARIYAVRALGRSDEKAVPALSELLARPDKGTSSERAEAARALGRLGAPGQKGLREAVKALVPDTRDPLKATTLVGPDFGALLAALEGLTALDGSRALVERYAKLEPPTEAPVSLLRRLSHLRCAAARVIAERDFDHPLLLACDLTAKNGDLTTSPIGGRAVLAAIGTDGTEIHGKRHRAWLRYLAAGDVVTRQAAIKLIAKHGEIEDVETVLLGALQAKEPGVVAAAAEVIARHPDRVSGRDADDDKKKGAAKRRRAKKAAADQVAKAVVALLDGKGAASDHEALAAVIDAAGALLLDSAKAPLGELCRSPHDVVRQHSEKALAQILGGAQKASCPAPAAGLPAPEEIDKLADATVKVRLDSDAGQLSLELDSTLAPLAVTRIRDLVTAGYYDGMIVDRVVPGFVSQLGSPTADTIGGAPGKAPLACETSPVRFTSGSVGMALAGRDTGVSQFFITHAEYPHLDGQYAWVGKAFGPWDALVEGDRVVKASVAP
jgi:cyclophilin family peptidyl-prolyl cis-trans isomerase